MEDRTFYDKTETIEGYRFMKKMKNIVVLHNIKWSHYTGAVLSSYDSMFIVNDSTRSFYVYHVAKSMESRASMGDVDNVYHTYPHEVLFDLNFEETNIISRLFSLLRVISKSRCACLISFGYSDVSYWPVFLLQRLRGGKLIIVVNSTQYDHKRVYWKEKLKRLILKMGHEFQCYGEQHKQYLLSLGVKENKITIRPQAMDNDKFISRLKNIKIPMDLDKPYILFVGRLIEEKNLQFLINAYLDTTMVFDLVIIGDGLLRSGLESSLSITQKNNIRFLGAMTLDQILPYYKFAKAFVLPSISETWGLVVNEAMLSSLPVIVSSHCGCSLDLVKDGENGYTFDPYDQDALSLIFESIYNNPNLKRMGETSFKIIQKFSITAAAEKFSLSINKTL